MKFKLNDVVNIKPGYGLKSDRELNPWIVNAIELHKGKIIYKLESVKPDTIASVGFYEEALEKVGQSQIQIKNNIKEREMLFWLMGYFRCAGRNRGINQEDVIDLENQLREFLSETEGK